MVLLTSISTFITTFVCYGRYAAKSVHGKRVKLKSILEKERSITGVTVTCFRSDTSIRRDIGWL